MTTAAGMPCPICKVPLAMSDRQGVEIDYCPQCRGVWLDRGELDKIIARSAEDIAPVTPSQPAPRYQPEPPRYPEHQQGYGHQHGHYRKRKKSFLEELFD